MGKEKEKKPDPKALFARAMLRYVKAEQANEAAHAVVNAAEEKAEEAKKALDDAVVSIRNAEMRCIKAAIWEIPGKYVTEVDGKKYVVTISAHKIYVDRAEELI